MHAETDAMIERIFSSLPGLFDAEAVAAPTSFYFSLGDLKKTVFVSAEQCRVEDGRTVENADCVCKTSPMFFLKIWQDGYRPGLGDFLSGSIKSNNTGSLQQFLKVFGKAD